MNRLKELRLSKGLNITQLSEKTNIARPTLSAIENNRRRISIEHGRKLADFFNVTLEYLLCGNKKSTTEAFDASLEAVTNSFFDSVTELALNDYKDNERIICQYNIVDRIRYMSLQNLRQVLNFINEIQEKKI